MNKKHGIFALALAVAIATGISGCSAGASSNGSSTPSATPNTPKTEKVVIKQSPDKYTWYVKDYRGINAASIGYTALDGMRRDQYGNGLVVIKYVTNDGTFLDPQNEDGLKQYAVVNQNVKPNTELKLEFQKKEDGTEYDNLTSFVSCDEIVLAVNKVGDNSQNDTAMTEISMSPDKYNAYVKDYVGRNLAACGYVSLGGFYADHYGNSYIKLNVTAEDGSFVEIKSDGEDGEASSRSSLSGYVVTSQSVAPNTPITMTYTTDSNGNEYDTLVNSMSLNSIDLTVKKIEP